MPRVRRLTVRGRYENIPLITAFVAEAAEAAGLDEDAVFHCQMAVDEACTNVIEHAYGGEDIGDIEITCLIEPGSCTIRIVDHGQPFDPDSVPPPRATEDIGDLQPGGIGLHLMRKFMDEVSFDFSPGQNTLTMVKRQAVEVPPSEGEALVSTREERDGVWRVVARGRLDAVTAPQLEETLLRLVEEGRTRLMVDMEQVTYISSRGLKALISAWRAATQAGGDLVLCALSERIRSVFETVGFTRIFAIYPACSEALSALSSADRDVGGERS